MGKGGRNGAGAKVKLLEAVDTGKEVLTPYERVTSAHPYLAIDFATQDGEAEIDGVSVPYVDTHNLKRPDVIPMRGWPENRWPVNVLLTSDISSKLKAEGLTTPFSIGGLSLKAIDAANAPGQAPNEEVTGAWGFIAIPEVKPQRIFSQLFNHQFKESTQTVAQALFDRERSVTTCTCDDVTSPICAHQAYMFMGVCAHELLDIESAELRKPLKETTKQLAVIRLRATWSMWLGRRKNITDMGALRLNVAFNRYLQLHPEVTFTSDDETFDAEIQGYTKKRNP